MNSEGKENHDHIQNFIEVGDVVEVLPRTWPGSNKLGGAARVTYCHYPSDNKSNKNETHKREKEEGTPSTKVDKINNSSDPDIEEEENENGQDKEHEVIINKMPSHVDVRYIVVGGREKKVPIAYVRAAPRYYQDSISNQEIATATSSSTTPSTTVRIHNQRVRNNTIFKPSQLRDRSSMLGRCTRCGSLRMDCNSCDYVNEEKARKEGLEANKSKANNEKNDCTIDKGLKMRNKSRWRNNDTNTKQNEFYFESSESELNYSTDDDFTDDENDDEYFHFSHNKKIYTRKSRIFIDDSSSSSSGLNSNIDHHISSSSDSSVVDDDDNSTLRLSKLVKKRTQQLAQRTMLEGTNVIVPTMSKLKQQKRKKKKLYENKYKKKVQFFKRGNHTKQSRRIDRMPKSVLESANAPSSNSTSKDGKRRKSQLNNSQTIHSMVTEYHKEDESPLQQQEGSDDELPSPAFHNDAAKECTSDNLQVADDGVEIDNQQRKQYIGYVHDFEIGEKEDDGDLIDTQMMPTVVRTRKTSESESLSQATIDNYSMYVDPSDSQTMNFDENFIQPEGRLAAENLPSDMIDHSVNVAFFELPTFYHSLEKEIRERKIPHAKRELQKLQDALDIKQDASHQTPLIRKSYSIFIELCREMVRDGTDQCRSALKRFGSKKNFRQNKSSGVISKKDWKNQIDTLDLKFDQLDKEVDEIVRYARELWELAKNARRDDDPLSLDYADDSHSDDNDSDHLNEHNAEIQRPSIQSVFHPHAQLSREKRVRSRKSSRPQKVRGNIHHSERKRRKIERIQRDNCHLTNEKENSFNNYSGSVMNTGTLKSIQSKRRVDQGKKKHPPRSISRSDVRRKSLEELSFPDRNKIQVNDNGKNDEMQIFETNEQVTGSRKGSLTEEILFDELIEVNDRQHEIEQTLLENSLSLREVCNSLLDAYPNDINKSISKLKLLPDVLGKTDIDNSAQHDTSVVVFTTLLNIFRDFASTSLQEVIQTEQQMKEKHIELLICTMKILKSHLQDHLVESDGILYKIFTTSGEKSIVYHTMQQLIDVMYSQLLPIAWGNPIFLTSDTYVLLKQLRNEIGQLVHMNEIASKILLKTLSCQMWQKSKTNKWFVSAVYSDNIFAYYKGFEGSNISTTRLRSLGRLCPRSEIVSIWSLMAFFSGSKSCGSESVYIWKILPSLFSFQSGVFGKQMDDPLPPSHSQLQRCAKEVKYLSILLDSHTINPLPNEDVILVKILLRSIHLDSEAAILGKRWSNRKVIIQTMTKQDERFAENYWAETEIATEISLDNCVAKYLLNEYNSESNAEETMFSMSCDSNILRSCVLLVSSWMAQIPNKKARWKRCQEHLTSLIKRLTNAPSATVAGTTQEQDDFARLFSNNFDSQSKDSIKIVAKREATATLIVGIIHACVSEEVKCKSKIPLPLGSISIELLNQVWEIVSNERMNHHLRSIMNNKLKSIDGIVNDSLDIPFIAMKLISWLTLVTFDGLNSHIDEDYWNSFDNECFSHSVTMILASLMSVNEILEFRLKSSHSFLSSSTQMELEVCFNVLSCGFLWLSSLLSYGRFILKTNFQKLNDILQKSSIGRLASCVVQKVIPVALSCLKVTVNALKETRSSRTCLLLCVSLIQSSISFHVALEDIKRNSKEDDNIPVNSDKSMLGGIDDEMLMSINLDLLVGGYSDKDDSPLEQLADFLFDSLNQSKPSNNFNHTSATLSSCGKILCSKNARAICSIIASICEIETENQVILQKMIALSSSSSQSMHADMDPNYLRSDVMFLQQLRQYFAFDVTKLMKRKTSKIPLNKDNISFLLQSFIEALLDANALNIFPTSNYEIMLAMGGESIKEREEKIAQRFISCFEEAFDGGSNIDSDAEVHLLTRAKRQPGLFMAKYLWSFASDLATVLKRDSTDQLMILGNVISGKESDMKSSVRELCDDVVGSLSFVSMERQCMKRLMALTRIFDAITTSLICHQQENIMKDILATAIKQMFQELDVIGKGTQYNSGDDSNKSYHFAKLHALQNSYSSLFVTAASCLIKQISLKNITSCQRISYLLLDHLLLPSLQFGLYNSNEKLSNYTDILSFDFTPQFFGSGEKNQSLFIELFNASNRHVRDIALDIGSIQNKDDRDTRFYHLMSSTFRRTEPNNKIIIHLLPALVSNIEYNDGTKTSLSIALDLYVSLISMNASTFKEEEERLLQQFRRYAVNFLVRNLFSKDHMKRSVMIDHLIEILDIASFNHNNGNDSNFEIIVEGDISKGYLRFEEDVLYIVYGLSSCIESSLHSSREEESSILMKLFICLQHLLQQIKIEGIEILRWCQERVHMNNCAKYILTEMRFLYYLLQVANSMERHPSDIPIEMRKQTSKLSSSPAKLELFSKVRHLMRKDMKLGHELSIGANKIYQRIIDEKRLECFNELVRDYL